MTPERWERIKQVYHSALGLEPGRREAFLKEACAGDETLCKEVMSLLAQEGNSEGFFESPALQVVARELAEDRAQEPSTDLVGHTLSHYRIEQKIGEGGMGVVYRARDPRLGRDVAIKVLPGEVADSPERLQRFEREARAVAALNHPNILTVFDVGTHDGAPYVVTELLEGETLRAFLSRHSPTLRQVLSFAVQAARGLEAAHSKGIIHRDIKPENLFVTGDGRIKILDFGLAKQLDLAVFDGEKATATSPTKPGMVLGTVAYMSPEQVRGLPLDARTDVFSFGVVLYELLSGRHPFRKETRADTSSAILNETPPELSVTVRHVSPQVAAIVARCLEKAREERFASGHDLVVALEAVTAGASAPPAAGVEERSPYPGLSSFTEKDAAHFFGREEEVKALWQRLQKSRLLAVIGPSGAGKTSFVRAGVIPAAPEGWRCVWVTPGNRPFAAVVRALVPELSNDSETLQRLVGAETGDEMTAALGVWRRRHGEALVVVDQFEELFTLNPGEVQERFAVFLGRLASEADVHVLISLRDDFLMRCQEHPALAPVFTELTPLGTLTKEGLRRALEEPAKKLGYRFEDDALVDEMVGAVEGARAALPLLAFAVSRLWEKRDRERKLLTRAAHEEIGGVVGALAQHAEAVMDRIGVGQDVVREIFRNLVTAQGTRAVVDRDELLSAFPEKRVAEGVLRELIDARLVTSYEVEGREGEASHHRVEVAHESLLKAWPRLVRWQAQDEEGAVLRDQLKQAAHLWEERGRPADLLWSGTSFREYELWHERYPGTLTALEEDFARSMAERAQRQRRRWRLAVGAVIAAALLVAAVTGVLWKKSEAARVRSVTEALRAEASKLLALGRLDLDTYPTAALAYARKSLELADTPEARKFALEALWRGPVARFLPAAQIGKGLGLGDKGQTYYLALSRDGRWLATGRNVGDRQILLFPQDGGRPMVLPRPPDGNARALDFGPNGNFLITGGSGESLRFWSLPDLREIRSVQLDKGLFSRGVVRGAKLFTFTMTDEAKHENLMRVWPLPDGEPKILGVFKLDAWDIDASGTRFAYVLDRKVNVRPLDTSGPTVERVLGSVRDEVSEFVFAPNGDRLASLDKSGELRLWSLGAGKSALARALQGPKQLFNVLLAINGDGTLLATPGIASNLHVWDLRDPPDAEPVILKWPDVPGGMSRESGGFDPSGRWLIESTTRTVAFWPIAGPSKRALHGIEMPVVDLDFSPDGRWLASRTAGSDAARLWPMSPTDGKAHALAPLSLFSRIAFHPAGRRVLVHADRKFLFVPIEGGPPQQLLGREQEGMEICRGLTIDAQGKRVVAAGGYREGGVKDPKQRVLRVWDLESGQEQVFSIASYTDASWSFDKASFAPNGAVFVGGWGGVLRVVLPSDPNGTVSAETLYAGYFAGFDLSRDGRYLLVWGTRASSGSDGLEDLFLFDLATHSSRRITTHGRRLISAALDPSGHVIVSGDVDGVVRVGPATGEEPHLLLGHSSAVGALSVSPDGRRIASVSDDALYFWPMPDITKSPFHTLPHDELMAKLRALTNLQVVEDKTAATGWKLEIGPFPGWKDVPTW